MTMRSEKEIRERIKDALRWRKQMVDAKNYDEAGAAQRRIAVLEWVLGEE